MPDTTLILVCGFCRKQRDVADEAKERSSSFTKAASL